MESFSNRSTNIMQTNEQRFNENVFVREPLVWPNFLWRNYSDLTKCHPIQELYPEKVDHLHIQLIFSVLYFAILLSAIFGNTAVIYVVTLKHVTLSSVRSVFICSLAASDILMSLTSLPITAVSIFTRDWVFPKALCKMMGVFQGGSVFVSSFTLTAIAVDRYILIRHPTSQKINFQTAVGIVLFIWMLGYGCALPVGIFSSTVEFQPFCGMFCDEIWPDTDEFGVSRMRKAYGLTVLFVQFVMPTIISSLCYWQIGNLIEIQMRKRSQHQIVLQESRDRMQNRKNRTNRMMISMVIGLVLAWLPMNLINLLRDFDLDTSSDGGTRSSWYSLIFAACHSIAMTSAVWNPIIYSFFNPQFRETIRGALERRRLSQTLRNSRENNLAPSPSILGMNLSQKLFNFSCKRTMLDSSSNNPLLIHLPHHRTSAHSANNCFISRT